MCDAQYSKCRKCDHRCNAKQCTVLWMGRQVLYEWRGSCDRSTSQSRYFSLTVNTHTRDQPVKTIARLRGWKRARHARKQHICALRRTIALCRAYGRARGGFLTRFFYEWRLWYVNESDWEKKKDAVSSLSMSTRWARRAFSFCFVLVFFLTSAGLRNENKVCAVLINDFVLESWRTDGRTEHTKALWLQCNTRASVYVTLPLPPNGLEHWCVHVNFR